MFSAYGTEWGKVGQRLVRYCSGRISLLYWVGGHCCLFQGVNWWYLVTRAVLCSTVRNSVCTFLVCIYWRDFIFRCCFIVKSCWVCLLMKIPFKWVTSDQWQLAQDEWGGWWCSSWASEKEKRPLPLKRIFDDRAGISLCRRCGKMMLIPASIAPKPKIHVTKLKKKKKSEFLKSFVIVSVWPLYQ